MQFDEFKQAVQERGGLPTATGRSLRCERPCRRWPSGIVGGETTDLASQLPQEIAAFVQETAGATRDAEIFDATEFCRRVGDREGGVVSAELAEATSGQ